MIILQETSQNPFSIALKDFVKVKKQMTQQQIAVATGLNQSLISRLMRGKNIRDKEHIQKLIAEKCFDLPYQEVLKRGEDLITKELKSNDKNSPIRDLVYEKAERLKSDQISTIINKLQISDRDYLEFFIDKADMKGLEQIAKIMMEVGTTET